jgi:peptidoglycan-associated lipoprotein
MKNSRQWMLLALAAAISVASAACAKKKVATAAPPPPTVAPAPSSPQTSAPPRTPAQPAPQQAASTPVPRVPNAATKARIEELLARIEDAYFDYDKHDLRPDAITALQADSSELRDILKDYPTYKLTIEGYCDERGSEEYNLALGDERARAARNYLTQVGIPESQLSLISYGKERPVCQDHNEACWQRNRRIHIVAMAQTTR